MMAPNLVPGPLRNFSVSFGATLTTQVGMKRSGCLRILPSGQVLLFASGVEIGVGCGVGVGDGVAGIARGGIGVGCRIGVGDAVADITGVGIGVGVGDAVAGVSGGGAGSGSVAFEIRCCEQFFGTLEIAPTRRNQITHPAARDRGF